jgi:hypothetical protein
MNKLYIEKKWKSKINKTKVEIDQLHVQQEEIVSSLAKKMKIAEGTEDFQILWDHIYNDSEWMITFEK